VHEFVKTSLRVPRNEKSSEEHRFKGQMALRSFLGIYSFFV